MKSAIFLTLALLFGAVPAQAAQKCYSPEEIQAEQSLRLHSELMVITVTCKRGSMGEDLVKAYTGFTRDNVDMLRESEATMTKYYKKVYGGKGVDQLDRLRTLLANEYGQRIADMSAPAFCAKYRDKVLVLYGSNSKAVQGEILQVSGRTYDPPCSSLTKVASKDLKKGK